MAQRKLLVLGPMAQLAIVIAMLTAAVVFYLAGDRVQPAILIAALVSHLASLLPVARGRPTDIAKIVTRGGPKPPKTPPPPPLPLPIPPLEEDK